MTDTPRLTVRCTDCVRDEDTPWLPWISAQSCRECAETLVAKHLEAHPGHRCQVIPQPPERVPENVHQLTRRNQ